MLEPAACLLSGPPLPPRRPSRARQRLWLYDQSPAGHHAPMLRYWQARGLLEQRPLSEELRQSMLTQSTPEQWRAKGFELFNKGLYGDAKRCFGKAGEWVARDWLAGWLAAAQRRVAVIGSVAATGSVFQRRPLC